MQESAWLASCQAVPVATAGCEGACSSHAFALCRHIVRYPPLPGGPSGVFPPDQLSRLTAPTIIICGEHDIWPCKATAAAAAALPDCKTIIIPGAKHFPAKQHLIQAADWILDWFAVKGLVPAATK